MAGMHDLPDKDSKDDDDGIIYRKTANHLQQYWNASKDGVNIKRTMEPLNALLRALRQRLAVHPSTREAVEEGGDDRPASFGVTQSGQTVIFPSIATTQTTRARPEPCAFARGGPEASEDGPIQRALNSGGGDLGGGLIDVGGGPVEEIPRERTWATAEVGDPTLVTPIQACSSYRAVTPRFGVGAPSADQQRVWSPAISLSGKSPPATSASNRPLVAKTVVTTSVQCHVLRQTEKEKKQFAMCQGTHEEHLTLLIARETGTTRASLALVQLA